MEKGTGKVQLRAESDVEAVEKQRREQAEAMSKKFEHESPNEPAAKSTTQARQGPKVGRNEPCPCGSGKKYKQCCGKLS